VADGGNSVTPINVATNKPGPFIPAGHYPIALAVSGDAKTLYVADYPSGTVTPVSTTTNRAGRPIPVARRPYFVLGAP